MEGVAENTLEEITLCTFGNFDQLPSLCSNVFSEILTTSQDPNTVLLVFIVSI